MTSTRALVMAPALIAFALLGSACATPTAGTTAPPLTTAGTTAPGTTAPPTSTAPVATTTAIPTCPANVADQLSVTGQATQLVLVEATGYATTSATLSAWQRQGPCWVSALGSWSARIGLKGFSDHHVEGDDTTPTGEYGIGPVMYGDAANPGVHYPYHRLICGDWWDEDPASPQYNTFEHAPCDATDPFGPGSEALWQETVAYPSFAVVDYNASPTVPGAGSGIFIHADIGAPTNGCVSLPLAELDDLLRWLQPADDPLVVMAPGSEIDRF